MALEVDGCGFFDFVLGVNEERGGEGVMSSAFVLSRAQKSPQCLVYINIMLNWMSGSQSSSTPRRPRKNEPNHELTQCTR